LTLTDPKIAPAARTELTARRRILVVDDDATQLRAIGRLLKRYADRIDLVLLDSGVDALVEVGVSRPHLVVMDVHMPGLDGVEACRRLKANPSTRDVDVVLASAAMTPELARDAVAAGATRAVSKPFDVVAILDEVTRHDPATGSATGGVRVVSFERPPAQDLRAAEVLVEMLVDAGVTQVFGLPGGPISPVHDALLDSPIHVVTTRHESAALFAAAGYAHTTGRLGVAVVTSGPGVLNAMTGLASAWCDGLPVLLLVGEAPRRLHGKGVLQDGSAYGLNIAAMAAHVTKLAAEVPTAQQLPHLLRRAMTTARSGRRGPVLLTLPMDVSTAMIARPVLAGDVAVTTAVAPEVIDEVVGLIAGAARPLILAGSGVRGGDVPARLRRVAERLQCPVATTPKGKGVFPEDHPLALGVLGLGGHPSARAYLDGEPDVVVAIGTSLGDLATDGFAPQLQASRALVHVDVDGRQLGRSYAPTHAIVGTAGDVLAGLEARAGSVVAFRRRAGGVIARHELPPGPTPDTIAPHLAVAELQRALPDDTIFTVDSGEHFLWATHYLRIRAADAYVVMTGLGSMGQSIGAAIGAQLGHPGRSVAAIVGDGCFAMTGFEIATAVAERLPIRIIVFNDQRLGMVEIGHAAVYGRRPHYPTGPMDVCAVAESLGAVSLRICAEGELTAAAELLRGHPGPVVVDVRIDPAPRLPRKDRLAAFAPPSPAPFCAAH
jgi:acetolactate synthase I/II/III large subunit